MTAPAIDPTSDMPDIPEGVTVLAWRDARPVFTVRDVTVEVGEHESVTLPHYYVAGDEGMPHFLEWLEKQRVVAYDIETSSLSPFEGNIATMQFGNPLIPDKRAYVLDVRCISFEYMKRVLDVLRDPTVVKLGQNMKFECKWTLWHYSVLLRNVMDTQVAELVLRAGLFEAKDNYASASERAAYKWCSMAKLAMRYLHLNIDKDHDLRTSFYSTPPGTHSERQIRYAAGDVVYPFYIAAQQRKEIETRALGNIIKIEFGLIPILADAEITGLRIDVEKWKELWQESVKLAADTERALDSLLIGQHDLFGGTVSDVRPLYTVPKRPVPVNYGSPQQKPWVIKQYCERIGWHCEVVISKTRAIELKKQYGEEWMEWQRKNGKQRDWLDVPDHLVPEDKYCLLLDADKNTLKLRMLRGQLPQNIVKLLLDWSTYEKRASGFGIDFLKKNVDAVERLRTEIHQCATATGRMSTTPNCYDAATEILTERGWVPFPELRDEDAVAQVDPDTNAISFVVPLTVVRQRYNGPMVRLASEHIDLLVTPNHRMLIERRSGRREITTAEHWKADRKHFHAGTYVGGRSALTPDEVRLLVAVQADAHRDEYGGLDFSFHKERKFRRLLAILGAVGVAATTSEREGWYRVRIVRENVPAFLGLLGPDKAFGSWVLDLTRDSLTAFAEELWHWDGCLAERSQYCSTNRANADWVQVALALSGARAQVRPYTNPQGLHAWVVDVRWEDYSWTTTAANAKETVPYDDTIYCVTVPTGMVVVRRHTPSKRAVVSISGNTQNIPGDPRYRACFIPGEGFKFVIADYSQIEPRLTAQVSKDATYMAAFLANDDIYLVVATAMFGYRPDKHTPEGAVVRQIAKIIVLALAYRMGPAKLRDALTLGLEKEILKGLRTAPTLEEARELWDKFFESCQGVREFQELMASLADPKASPRGKLWDEFLGEWVTWVEGPCGRKRFFPPSAFSTYTEGPNAPIQGSSATITKAAAVLIQKEIDAHGYEAHLVNAIHDELMYEVREDQADEFKWVVKECMERAGRFYVTDVPVIAEFPENSTGVLDFWAKKLKKPEQAEEGKQAA